MRLRNSQRFSTIVGSGISAWSMDVCSVMTCKEAVCSSYVRRLNVYTLDFPDRCSIKKLYSCRRMDPRSNRLFCFVLSTIQGACDLSQR